MYAKKATKIGKIFTSDLTLCSKCQIDGEDFINFCGLLRKHELYKIKVVRATIVTYVLLLSCKKILDIFLKTFMH